MELFDTGWAYNRSHFVLFDHFDHWESEENPSVSSCIIFTKILPSQHSQLPRDRLFLGVSKRINELNSNQIVNELGQDSINSYSISLLNELKFQNLDSIRLIHLIELVNESNRIRIRLLFVYP